MTEIRPPFGTYALPGILEQLRVSASSFPKNRLGRLAVSVARKICLLSGRNPVDVEIYPTIRARVYPGSNRCEKRILAGPQFFDLPERRFLTEAVEVGDRSETFRFLDLGANVGMYSLWVIAETRRIGRPVKVVAVEPDKITGARLRTNIAASDASDLIDVASCGVGGKAGKARMIEDTNNRGGNHIDLVQSDDADDDVFVVATIPEICDAHGLKKLDALKIDVEGYDYDALDGLFKSKRFDLFPTWIQAEIGRDNQESELVRLCEANGYRSVTRTKLNIIMQQSGDLAAGDERI
ncbi:MAG: FkbM family methyltransferase [Roseibium sp.]